MAKGTTRVEKDGHRVSIANVQIKGRNYYQVRATILGRRETHSARTLEEAEKKANKLLAQLVAKGGLIATYKPSQVAAIEAAKEVLDKIQVPLTSAINAYAEAIQYLPPGVSLVTAVRGYVERIQRDTETPILVSDLVEKYKAALREKKVKEGHLYSVGIRLDRAASYFKCNVADVTAADVDQWLQQLGVGPQTRKHHRRTLIALFRFAQRKDYLVAGLTAADKAEAVTVPSRLIDAYSPEQASYLVEKMPERWRAYMAIGLFSGIRPAELFRLEWSDIKEDHIEVKASGSKVKLRRLVPISDNLAAWIESIPDRKGPIVRVIARRMKGKNLKKKLEKETLENLHARQAQALSIALRETVRKAIDAAKEPKATKAEKDLAKGFSVIHDGLRHSYISYRVAILKDLAAVALEAGNSVEVIKEHYNKVATPTEAERYFAIRPKSPFHNEKNVA